MAIMRCYFQTLVSGTGIQETDNFSLGGATMKLSIRHLGVLCGLWFLQYSGSVLAFTLIPQELFLPGTEVTEQAALDTQVQPVTSALSGHFRSIFRNHAASKGGGAAAGDNGPGVWANSSFTDFKNTFALQAFDGTSHSLLLGIDFSIDENHLLGIALGSEATDIDTTFNLGNQETKSKTLVPYYAWLISDNYSIDLSMGSSDLDTDQHRVLPFTVVPPSGAPTFVPTPSPITSSVSGERRFSAFNLNAFWTLGSWNLGGRIGYQTTTSDRDAYTESDGTEVGSGSIDLKQNFIGGDIAYILGAIEPFIGVMLQKDSMDEEEVEVLPGFELTQPPEDDESKLLSAGFRYYGEEGLSAILEWNGHDDKKNYSDGSISFTLRKDFD
jgi:hypothetical protein